MHDVLHLINTAGPGGAETVYLGLVGGLDPRRWRSHAVVPEVDWLTEQLRSRGMPPGLDAARSRFDLAYLGRLARRVRRDGIRVVHSHLFGPTVEASVVGLLTGVPVVGTIHGKGDLSPDERLRRVKFELLARGASRVVFVSESLRDHFLAQGPLPVERTAVIPNGVDMARHVRGDAVARRAELGIPAGRFVVGAVGNLRTVKRYDLLLRAAARLRAHSADYHFVIVGQTPPALHAELLALRDSLGLRDAVDFTGFRDDVERVMDAFDLFALTSDSEGFSIATVQAMASGLPVVATRCGGPEEILRDGRTGVLVPAGSPEAVADAVDRLRREPATRARLGAAARASAVGRFSLAAQVQRYEALYEEVIAERRQRIPSLRRAAAPEPPPLRAGSR